MSGIWVERKGEMQPTGTEIKVIWYCKISRK